MAEATEEIAPPVAAALSSDVFDVNAWLADTNYAEDSVEVYNNGTLLRELSDLTDAAAQLQERVNANEKAVIKSIIDEQSTEIAAKLEQASEQIELLRESLRGTGVTFHFQGIPPEKRRLLQKALEKTLKEKPPVVDDDGNITEPGYSGGSAHPDFPGKWETTLIRESFVKMVSMNGSVSDAKLTDEDIESLHGQMLDPEWVRLSNCAFDVNFYQYDIDRLVDIDFS